MLTARFTYTAGALVRGSIKRDLELLAFKHDLTIDIKEFKGWFKSDYGVVAKGEDYKVRAFLRKVDEWLKRIAEE